MVPVSQIGVYGNYTTIDWLYQHGLANYFCESNAWPEPQGWHPQAQMHQYVDSYYIGGVHVDRLTVTAADFGQCRRHEESDPRFYYSGSWTTSSTPAGVYSGGACEYSGAAGASVTVGFYGTSLDWIATKSPDGGSARISLDGADVSTISLYSATPEYQQKAWSSGLLSDGPHVLTISQSTGSLNVDAFDIAGKPHSVHPTIGRGGRRRPIRRLSVARASPSAARAPSEAAMEERGWTPRASRT